MTHQTIITVDGPAAAGKGTIARAIGHYYDMAVLDTGLLYRLVGLTCHRGGIDPHDLDRVAEAAEGLAQALRTQPDLLDNPDWRGRDAGIYASVYGAIPGVRAALTDYQRSFADHPPLFADGRHATGAVLDGRDCGTVICPDAPLKIYVTAHVDERARRRHMDLQARGDPVTYQDVLQDLMVRDHRDMTRAVAPTHPAEDAVMIDTTGRTREDIVTEVSALVQSRLGLHPAVADAPITTHIDRGEG